MLKVGLTGGIGSGKTTVAHIFEVLGIPVYYADDAAKRIMQEDEALKQLIKDHFGSGAYVNEMLNRPYLASVVFSSPEKLDLLNSIVHPATLADAERWMQQQSRPYAVKEAALIFESKAHLQLNHVIGVHAPLDLRMQRAMQRDQLSKEEVLARMKRQMEEEKKMELCDFMITNNEMELLIPQVLALHEKLLKLAIRK